MKRGFTLIELLVGTAVALIMTAAAVTFATQETRLLTRSRDKLEVAQAGRSALALLGSDLRKAGAGVGYREDGTFLGIDVGQFTAGGLAFNPQGFETADGNADTGVFAQNDLRGPPGVTYADVPTQDVLIQFADGELTTVSGEIRRIGAGIEAQGCRALENDSVAVMRDQTGISSLVGLYRTTLLGVGAGNCQCNDPDNPGTLRCVAFILDNAVPLSGGTALSVRYGYGEIQSGATSAVWFVAANADNEGELRKAELDLVAFDTASTACAAGRQTCGEVVAFGVEALYLRVWRFDRGGTETWIPTGGAPTTATDSRLRVDVEIVMRGNGANSGDQPELQSSINGRCFPGGACGVTTDTVPRVAHRTSVEIINSGIQQ